MIAPEAPPCISCIELWRHILLERTSLLRAGNSCLETYNTCYEQRDSLEATRLLLAFSRYEADLDG